MQVRRQAGWREPFTVEGRISAPLVAAFLVIHLVLAVNAFRHSPLVQYDSTDHEKNIAAYAAGRFPTPDYSREFFSAPLAYAIPALVMRTTGAGIETAIRCGQLLNLPLSALMFVYLLRILLLAGDVAGRARLAALVLLGMLPAFHRTFAMARGEALITALALPALYHAIQLFLLGRRDRGRALKLGLLMGSLALARQWGILLLLAMGAFAGLCLLRYRDRRGAILRDGLVAAIAGALVCGWFYLHLQLRHGSMTAFNHPPRDHFSLSNRPAEFFTGTGDGNLFTRPFRRSFDQQFLPVFYSDTWGDYWGYFLVYGRDTRDGHFKHGFFLVRAVRKNPGADWLETNMTRMVARMGVANIVALFPTFLLLLGIAHGSARAVRFVTSRESSTADGISALALSAIACTAAGYFWWLLMYRTGEGSSIKATYVMQLFPLAALLGGLLAGRIHALRPHLGNAVLAILLLTATIVSPLWFSRFVP